MLIITWISLICEDINNAVESRTHIYCKKFLIGMINYIVTVQN